MYFLAGHDTGSQGLGQHWMAMNADHYLPVSEVQIPTGPIADVGGTVFDLRIPSQLVDRLPNCPGGPDFNGYDHNFCIIGSGMKFVCRVEHKETERALEVRTNQPGVQFYTGILNTNIYTIAYDDCISIILQGTLFLTTTVSGEEMDAVIANTVASV
jgi:galactose mutarotase-like enzyme